MPRLFSAFSRAVRLLTLRSTNRRRRRQPFVIYHHQAGLGGVSCPAKQLTGLSCTTMACDSSRRMSSTTTKGKAQASRRHLGDRWGQRRVLCVLFLSLDFIYFVCVFFGDVDCFLFLPLGLFFAPCGRLQPRKSCLRNGTYGIQIMLYFNIALFLGGGWVGGLVSWFFARVAAHH